MMMFIPSPCPLPKEKLKTKDKKLKMAFDIYRFSLAFGILSLIFVRPS